MVRSSSKPLRSKNQRRALHGMIQGPQCPESSTTSSKRYFPHSVRLYGYPTARTSVWGISIFGAEGDQRSHRPLAGFGRQTAPASGRHAETAPGGTPFCTLEPRIIPSSSKQSEDCFQKAVSQRGLRCMRLSARRERRVALLCPCRSRYRTRWRTCSRFC